MIFHMIFLLQNIGSLFYISISPYITSKIQYIDYEDDDEEDADDDELCYCKSCQIYRIIYAFMYKRLQVYEE